MTVQMQYSRSMRYTTRSAAAAVTWQVEVRRRLQNLLMLDDLVAAREQIPLDAVLVSSEQKDGYRLQELEQNSTHTRRMKLILTTPEARTGPYPAVVCIHGHGGERQVVHDSTSIYCGFAKALAQRGYATISTDVGQHDVYEQNRTLMGERLWDLMRCIDQLESLPDVDASRVGCAGLSLGGEMAMWLGAMDERIAATLSAGFLTNMDQMEQGHCMCWKFDGLRDLVDFADIYSLMAPRPLLCQNGLKEPASQFPVPLAREALKEIAVSYGDFGKPENLGLVAHDGAHSIHLPSLLTFFGRTLSQ